MRRRITKAFFTAAAAGAAITFAASPAGAASQGLHFTPSAPQTATDANGTCGSSSDITGTWSSTDCGKAGYVATGRDFRFASAIVTIPNHTGSVAADPTLYVALDASATNNDFARVGVMPCHTTGSTAPVCPSGDTSGWEAFTLVDEPTTGSVINTASISTSLEGDGVSVSAYLVPTGNSVHFVVSAASQATMINTTTTVDGPVYTDAQALADWTTDTTQPAPVAANPKVRDTQFFQGRFTTTSGAQGTFSGPWTLHAVDATSNGSLPPSGTLIAQPSYLWNDGSGFHGQGNDAFGVWRFPF